MLRVGPGVVSPAKQCATCDAILDAYNAAIASGDRETAADALKRYDRHADHYHPRGWGWQYL